MERLLEALQRLGHPELSEPCGVVRGRIGWRWVWCNAPAAACRDAAQEPFSFRRWKKIDQGLAVCGNECVKVDQPRNATRRPVGNPRCHHAAVALPDQRDFVQT